MTVREVLEASFDAAVEIRRIEEQCEMRREMIGVQGHTYGIHSKSGIFDPARKVISLIDWEEHSVDTYGLKMVIEEACEVVAGIETITDGITTEVVTRRYLQGDTWNEIVRDMEERIEALHGLKRDDQVKCLSKSMDECMKQWELVGIAKLKQMGRR